MNENSKHFMSTPCFVNTWPQKTVATKLFGQMNKSYWLFAADMIESGQGHYYDK